MNCDYCKKENGPLKDWKLCEQCGSKLRRPKNRQVMLGEEGFAKMLKHLDDEIASLQLVDETYVGVGKRLSQYHSVRLRHPTFFGILWMTSRTDMITRLGRIYDRETGGPGCTLKRCLASMRDHPEWFERTAVERRLSPGYRHSNPDYMDRNTPTAKDLASWLNKIEQARGPLLHLRNKRFAHTDLETLLSGNTRKMLSKQEEVQALIALARDVWNYCSMVWHATTSSGRLLTGTNLDLLLRHLRRGIKMEGLHSRRRSRTPAGRPRIHASSLPTTRP